MRINNARKKIEELGLDGIIFTNLVNIRYLCGYSGSNGLLFVSKDAALFFTDFRYKTQIQTEVIGVKKIVPESGSLISALSERPELKSVKKIGFEKSITYSKLEVIKETLTNISEWKPTDDFVAEMRWIKTPAEIAGIEKAIEVAEKALIESKSFLRPGTTEIEFAAELEYNMRKGGSEKPAFDTITVSGKRSALIHGIPSDKEFETGDFITIDFGARVKGYHSDITRTFILGEPTAKQREIYELVLAAQKAAIDGLRAGMKGMEIDSIAREVITKAGYGEYFGHGLGHGLGLEVHDNQGIGAKSENIVPENSVITIEPGIYIPELGGVRIEDDVLVTKDGATVLSGLPKEIDDAIIV